MTKSGEDTAAQCQGLLKAGAQVTNTPHHCTRNTRGRGSRNNNESGHTRAAGRGALHCQAGAVAVLQAL